MLSRFVEWMSERREGRKGGREGERKEERKREREKGEKERHSLAMNGSNLGGIGKSICRKYTIFTSFG